MISYARENFAKTLDELRPVLFRGWSEVGQKDMILDPDFDEFIAQERAGRLALFTVRNDGALVGYSIFFLRNHLHYRNTVCAINDAIFLDHAHRRGRVGVRLIKFAGLGLAGMGAKKVYYHSKLAYPQLGKVLAALGYECHETLHAGVL